MIDTEQATADAPACPMLKYIPEHTRDDIPADSFAGPNRSFPIRSGHPEDVRNAWDLAGHAADPEAVRARIRAIARRLGMESALPETAGEGGGKSSPADSIEYKALDFSVKAMGDAGGAGTATLYVSVFGNRDRSGEVIAPGAFKNLGTFVKDGFFAVSHDWNALPVATITSATQDDHGLLLDIAFHSTPDAQAARTVMRERMERGKSVKSSIGYRVIEDADETNGGERTRYLRAIELFEASFVAVPCNAATDAVAVKGVPAAATKAGRVMSAANHSKLTGALSAIAGHAKSMGASHKSLMAACEDMGEFLSLFAPGAPLSDPDGDGGDDGSPEGDTDHDYAGKSAPAPAPDSIADKVAIPGAVAAPTLADRSARLVADAAELTGLFAKAADQRRADGRTLAPAKRAEIKAAGEALIGLYHATEPPPDPAEAEAEAKARLKFLRLKHQSKSRQSRRAGA